MRRLFIALLAALMGLAFGLPQAETYRVDGLINTFAQDRINADIAEATSDAQLYALFGVQPGQADVSFRPTTLHVDGAERVLSLEVTVQTPRKAERFGLMYDLLTGERLTAERFWSSGAQQVLDAAVEKLLSGGGYTMLDAEALRPVPLEGAYLTETGLYLPYPASRFALYSGAAGGFAFYFAEIRGALQLDALSLLSQLDEVKAGLGEGGLARVSERLARGEWPGLAPVIGQPIDSVLGLFGEWTDPELFLGRDRYVPADPHLRDITLVVGETDDLVQGLHFRRFGLLGLVMGESGRADVIKALGEPESELPFDSAAAQAYAMEAGSALSFRFGSWQLLVNLDTDGLLRAAYYSQAL